MSYIPNRFLISAILRREKKMFRTNPECINSKSKQVLFLEKIVRAMIGTILTQQATDVLAIVQK